MLGQIANNDVAAAREAGMDSSSRRLGQGAALGAVTAGMMSVIALSLPAMVVLRKVRKVPLLVAVAAIVGRDILLVG